ncbi:hypothetical protein [Plantactinospora sp. GCM10030261]|uniref:hypothetical protein n=1 Tax=Plantactinospora sp. GCM10030261 TaxID=3273420 RepID=UPI003615B576
MTCYRMPPNRPLAWLIAGVGTAIVVFGVTRIVGEPFSWFSVLWIATGITVVGNALVTALGKGGLRRFVRPVDPGGPAALSGDDEPEPHRVRPSRVGSVVGAVAGIGILIFGVTRFGSDGSHRGFVVLWILIGVVIIIFNLWTAWSPRGRAHLLGRRDR